MTLFVPLLLSQRSPPPFWKVVSCIVVDLLQTSNVIGVLCQAESFQGLLRRCWQGYSLPWCSTQESGQNSEWTFVARGEYLLSHHLHLAMYLVYIAPLMCMCSYSGLIVFDDPQLAGTYLFCPNNPFCATTCFLFQQTWYMYIVCSVRWQKSLSTSKKNRTWSSRGDAHNRLQPLQYVYDTHRMLVPMGYTYLPS